MERQGFTTPLLIGGATTSKAHTAVKIAPSYSQAVVHVLDASRAVGVVGSLMNPVVKNSYTETIRLDYQKVRAHHGEKTAAALLALAEARNRRTQIDWTKAELPRPQFTGLRVLASDSGTTAEAGAAQQQISLADLVPFIDWSPFFHTWEMRGRYPAILENPEARKLFQDAQSLLSRIVEEKLLIARGVYGFFPANSLGDDVELYTDKSRSKVLTVFHFLRQQLNKAPGQFNHCLADFIAPKPVSPGDAVLKDYLGAFAVSAGFGTTELCQEFEHDHDDYNSIMTKALADRLAEAFAEYLHKRARQDWGFGQSENLTQEELIREKYRGIRPAAGYPACPDHTEKLTLWKLLNVEPNTGIKLTESCAMWPGASVSGLYFAHPDAKYFGVGKIGHDQILDYHLRKQMDLQTVERWLGPYLNYEPQPAAADATMAAV
jgi:5-methyltetrahydrofolate--homocysteine methyltransferase